MFSYLQTLFTNIYNLMNNTQILGMTWWNFSIGLTLLSVVCWAFARIFKTGGDKK